MYYLKLNNQHYIATFTGRVNDAEWGNRESKTITTNELTYSELMEAFVDGVSWGISEITERVELYAYNEDGEEITVFVDEEGNPIPLFDADGNPIDEPLTRVIRDEKYYDNSDFNIAGPVTNNRDGSCSVKMGKQTALEEAYELLYGGLM